jgi:hypothetical protein
MHRIAFVTSLQLAACGSNSTMTAQQFDTFQLCYNEHTQMESLSPMCAIEICCIDHPIGPGAKKGNIVCGTTTASCQSYVTPNLTDPNDTMLTTDIQQACTFYPVDGMHGGTGPGGMCSG